MELTYSLFFMIIGSFIIHFLIMSLVMTDSVKNITFSQGKFYVTCIMTTMMGLLEVVMFDFHMKTFSIFYYVFFSFMFILFIYLYRNQVYIDSREYLKEMIEHHSMALLTSEEILQKQSSQRVRRLAENIISTQQKEIEYMNMLLKTEEL